MITIFYAPLATVYKAANIADSLGDLQTFINDLIRTVESTEERESVSELCFPVRRCQTTLRRRDLVAT